MLVAALVVAGLVTLAVTTLGGGGDDDKAVALVPRACERIAERSSMCPDKGRFEAARYVDHADAFDCIRFASQADAQAVLRADPRDPNRLDPDHDGVACRERPAPKDVKPVGASAARFRCTASSPRSLRCPRSARRFDAADYLRTGVDAYDCRDFASQADAQAVLRFQPDDPNRLDSDGNGIACPELPAPRDRTAVPGRPAS